jgi:hypothetical protein
MTAKSKAFQAMAVISLAAITYTLSNSSSEGTKTTVAPLKEQTMQTVVVKAKAPNKQKQAPTNTSSSNEHTVPGYSNPDESIR